MTPLEKRIQELKDLINTEKQSPNPSKLYIDDLKLSIQQLEAQLPNVSKKGYRMVKV